MTATIPSLLQPMKDRLTAATPGPWRTWVDDTGRRGAAVETAWAHDEEGADTELITDWCSTEDATLIANAPTDQAKLIAAIEAVEDWLAALDVIEECDPSAPGVPNVRAARVASKIRTALTQALGGDTA